jgi:asparagine synthase (glutamine-hydrolysing)
MSAFAGKYGFDGAPAAGGFTAAIHDFLRRRGPDNCDSKALGQVYVACCTFDTAPETGIEVQPFVFMRQLVIAWDGRLDNREELRHLLGVPKGPHGDLEYIAQAYAKWSTEFLKYVKGDYALCLWDSREQRLLLARDPFGTRPLYYASDKRFLYWSSEIAAVVHMAGKNLMEIDDAYVAGYLTSTEELERTPYQAIKSVPPGYAVVFSANSVSKHRFWALDPKREIRYTTDSEYEEHFQELFRESVRRRLRVSGKVAAELSGGLDSSSVVCMADDILRRGSCTANALATISHVYNESQSSDESHFIRLIEEQRNQRTHFIKESDYPLFHPMPEDEELYLPSPLHCFAETWRGLKETMEQIGARVLLSGQGGDHVFLNETIYLPVLGDLAFSGRFSDLLFYLREWARLERKPYLLLMWNGIAWPTLPARIRNRCIPQELAIPGWMGRDFARRWDCMGRLVARPHARVLRRPSAERQYTLIYDAISLISPSYYRERCCVEISYPFLDQQIVEFLMAVPAEQKIRPGESRSLERRAMKPFLPEKITNRRDKRGPDEAVYRGLVRNREWINYLANDSRLAARGYVEADVFSHAVKLACHGADVQIQPMVRALTLEMWLRSHERWSKGMTTGSEPSSKFATVCR